MKIGIIGVGQWGKNLLRVFDGLAEVVWCSNRTNKATQEWIKEEYPSVKVTFDYSEVLKDASIEAVVVATPVKTHFSITKQALKQGKHVFLEKPMTNTIPEAEELIDLAEQNKLVLFIGHIFLYHPVYKRIKKLISQDPARKIDMIWNKFGSFKEDIINNLVSHDIAIMLDLLQDRPERIANVRIYPVISGADIISSDLYFEHGKTCTISINRVNPQKRKEVRIVTESGWLFYWLDDRLLVFNQKQKAFDLLLESSEEPLKAECERFIHCVSKTETPLTNGKFGLEVVKLLNALKRHMQTLIEGELYCDTMDGKGNPLCCNRRAVY